MKNHDFLSILHFISEMIQGKIIAIVEHQYELVCDLSNGELFSVISNDL